VAAQFVSTLSEREEDTQRRMAEIRNESSRRLHNVESATAEMNEKLSEHLQGQSSRLQDLFKDLPSLSGLTIPGPIVNEPGLARLEQELGTVRDDTVQQIAGARQEIRGEMAQVDQRVAGLGRELDGNRRDLASLRDELGRDRVDFEVAKNRSSELAPGISLGVTRTDIRYRRFDGWVWLLPDRRTVWVRDQVAQRPVVFYSKVDHRPYELVITHVTGNSVAGYLLAPSGSQSERNKLSRLNRPTR